MVEVSGLFVRRFIPVCVPTMINKCKKKNVHSYRNSEFSEASIYRVQDFHDIKLSISNASEKYFNRSG